MSSIALSEPTRLVVFSELFINLFLFSLALFPIQNLIRPDADMISAKQFGSSWGHEGGSSFSSRVIRSKNLGVSCAHLS